MKFKQQKKKSLFFFNFIFQEYNIFLKKMGRGHISAMAEINVSSKLMRFILKAP